MLCLNASSNGARRASWVKQFQSRAATTKAALLPVLVNWTLLASRTVRRTFLEDLLHHCLPPSPVPKQRQNTLVLCVWTFLFYTFLSLSTIHAQNVQCRPVSYQKLHLRGFALYTDCIHLSQYNHFPLPPSLHIYWDNLNSKLKYHSTGILKQQNYFL